MTTEPIWKTPFTVELANRVGMNTANAHMGIEMLEAGPDYVVGRMPVDHRTKQPAGILHGGASVLLAETLASWAGAFVVDATQQTVVGQEINANHLRPATGGWVTGTARPIHLGRRSQVWEIRITGDDGKLVCISRMTLAVVDRPGAAQMPQRGQ
ncbi:MAG: hotdog fold thioesterase [Rhodobacter sp.]|uniref:PaaI family thioesterase n=1 Tax=Pararhodobacter sp. TaxID=2127056 RepID=UPI001D81F139|nr:hotdog fold thioesterase [Pararhodobacter sp.]MCB1344969.1 hotdog fold thioesterase [Paracoccaceae bacterium]MCC0073442.1 hotdog fold thioesterase [Rhodobacter sp.]HPD91433.1 hotdog fold thioesterase [Pararhodobacter sp.]